MLLGLQKKRDESFVMTDLASLVPVARAPTFWAHSVVIGLASLQGATC
jgi:hypothetical protein